MLTTLFIACSLVAITVFVHAVGLALILTFLYGFHASPPKRFWPISGLLISVAWALILIHLIEISIWGAFYFWMNCLPDAESAMYFSGVTYTTIGYGDLVLHEPWRILGAVEGLTGILMCGLSAGIFFALVSKILSSHFNQREGETTKNETITSRPAR